MRKIILLIILTVQPLLSYAVLKNTGATFLKVSPGARPVGMGGAYSAISDDINALYYNPAGISNIENPQVGAMHTEWVDDIRYDFAAGAFNMWEGVFGVSATLLTMGELEGRGLNREETDGFGAYDFALQCSYGMRIKKSLIGGSIKYIRQQIEDENANGVAVDLGLQRKVTNNLNLGFSLRNLGPKMKFINEGYELPLILSIGSGLTIGGISLALDTNYEIADKNFKVSFGTEYMPVRFLSLRGGYFLNVLKNSNTVLSDIFEQKDGIGGGIGINVLNYNLNYAVVPYSELGTTQRISFLINF